MSKRRYIYFGADVEIVWHTIQEDLRPLKAAIEEIKKKSSD